MVKVIEVSDSSRQKTLRGHDAPVLSVAIDPKDVYLVKLLQAYCTVTQLQLGGSRE